MVLPVFQGPGCFGDWFGAMPLLADVMELSDDEHEESQESQEWGS